MKEIFDKYPGKFREIFLKSRRILRIIRKFLKITSSKFGNQGTSKNIENYFGKFLELFGKLKNYSRNFWNYFRKIPKEISETFSGGKKI